MFEQIIADYLKTNRRLVIPKMGSFIVKEQGGVVFSELLKRDDGVLRGLLTSRCGMSDLEAAGAIDRFVFEARRSLQDDLVFELKGLGVMTRGHNEAIIFRYQPTSDISCKADGCGVSGQDATDARSETEVAINKPKVSLSPKVNPEPCLKGLRYGKPQKQTAGYSYVGLKSSRGGRRVDKFLIVGIVAALLAIGAILYGYFSQSKKGDLHHTLQDEQVEQIDMQVVDTTAVRTE